MLHQYLISGQCISTVIHRLSMGLGDFEGIIYGTEDVQQLKNIGDSGDAKLKAVLTIHDVCLSNTHRLIRDPPSIIKAILACPESMKILGWISGKREVPATPSLGDRETSIYLETTKSKYMDKFSQQPLIFGCFCQNTRGLELNADMDPDLRLITHFEYKFYSANGGFKSIVVETQNLQNTDTQYNEMPLTYEIPETSAFEVNKEKIIQEIEQAPILLTEESHNFLKCIEELLPEVRSQNLRLEEELQKNLALKNLLYNK